MQIRTNRSYKYREIAGEYYLIPTSEAADRSKIPLQLTETAAWIWIQLGKGVSKEDLVCRMTEEYEVDPVAAGKAVDQFIEVLLEQGMLEKTATAYREQAGKE